MTPQRFVRITSDALGHPYSKNSNVIPRNSVFIGHASRRLLRIKIQLACKFWVKNNLYRSIV